MTFNKVTGAESQTIEALKRAVSGIDGRLETAEGDIDDLEESVSGLDGRLETAEGDIDDLEGEVDDLNDLFANGAGRPSGLFKILELPSDVIINAKPFTFGQTVGELIAGVADQICIRFKATLDGVIMNGVPSIDLLLYKTAENIFFCPSYRSGSPYNFAGSVQVYYDGTSWKFTYN